MRKTVIITGASRGIGAECAKLLAKQGYNVAINYCNSKTEAEKVKNEICQNGGNAEIFCADVSNYDAVKSMIQDVMRRFGNIDLLVCNAGVAHSGLLIDTTEEDFDRLININLKGVFNAVKCVLPTFLSKSKGNIICISSVWGQTGASCEVIYSATKSAIIGFSKALAKEVAEKGININCVSPGSVTSSRQHDDIDFVEHEGFAFGATYSKKSGSQRDNANLICFLASDEASYIMGQNIQIDGCRKTI